MMQNEIKLYNLKISIGEMAERFKAHAWKVCVPLKAPWVRIPISPPFLNFFLLNKNNKI